MPRRGSWFARAPGRRGISGLAVPGPFDEGHPGGGAGAAMGLPQRRGLAGLPKLRQAMRPTRRVRSVAVTRFTRRSGPWRGRRF